MNYSEFRECGCGHEPEESEICEWAHTPGPWKHSGRYVGTDEEDSQTICYVDDHRNMEVRDGGEHEANARLIAAAPDLLKSLNEYIAAVDAYYRNPDADNTGEKCAELVLVHERAISTIAKAEGRAL